MTSLTMVTAVGEETRFAYADVIAPPFKVKESARTRASNNLAMLACMARVDQNRSLMSRAWVVADRDEVLIPPPMRLRRASKKSFRLGSGAGLYRPFRRRPHLDLEAAMARLAVEESRHGSLRP